MKSLRLILFCFLLVFYPFVFPLYTFAASLTLSNEFSDRISSNQQEIEVKTILQINSPSGTIYFLRGVFFQEGTHNYCGYTWNGNNWFSGPYSTSEGWRNFLPVTISSSSAEAVIKAKVDTDDSGCKNAGTYKFKVQRFTQSGSSSFDTQNELTFLVYIPSITPQPTLTPIPPTPAKISSTAIKSSPTVILLKSVLSVTNIPVSTLTTARRKQISNPTANFSQAIDEAVLGTQADKVASESNISASPASVQFLGSNYISAFYLALGGFLFIISGILVYMKLKKNN